MKWSRRRFLLTGAGIVATGCASRTHFVGRVPDPTWPDHTPRPEPSDRAVSHGPAPTAPRAAPPRPSGPVPMIARARWSGGRPGRHLNMMGSVRRITVHHEGHKIVTFSDWRSTAARLEQIRRWHRDRGWADIGYHMIIDRAGRLWEGRDLRYQGAHVRKHNENNLGIMVLGNFSKQSPTSQQLARLDAVLPQLMRYYGLSRSAVKTHREWVPTTCPGSRLQGHMAAIRRRGVLA